MAVFLGGIITACAPHQAAWSTEQEKVIVSADVRRDVSKEISELRNTASYAELYLIGGALSPRQDLDQVDVVRMGCHYKTESREDLNGLIDVVEAAGVHQVPPTKEGLDTRIVLRFYGDKPHYTSLVMGQDYTDAPSIGRYYGPGAGLSAQAPAWTFFVKAKNGLQKSLRLWGAQHPFLAAKPCNQ
jgi:hypothetical protein